MINGVVNNGFLATPPAATSGPAVSGVSAKTSTPAPAASTSAAPTGTTVADDSQQLSAAVSKLNDYVQNFQRTLSFSIDKDTGATVVKITDSATNELIRQIPAEETLQLAASIDKELAHLFVHDRA